MTSPRRWRILLLLGLLLGTVGCDQTTKHLARTKLNPFDSVLLMRGWGELRLAENPGAFLSLGASLSPTIRSAFFNVGVGLSLLVLGGYLLGRAQWSKLVFTGLALVMSGGASNLIDRLTRAGGVTDFITLRFGPLQTGIFNVADFIIMVGLGLLIFAAWRPRPAVPLTNSPPD